jgi:uncharacterized protein (TIGR02186 family)
LAVTALVLAATPAARGQELVADLSRHRVAISTGFTGSQVVLFGATGGEGDVALVVRGPDERVVVRRKDRIAGIWVNRAGMVFEGVPAYYAVASNRPLEAFMSPAVMARNQIGVEHLRLTAEADGLEDEVATFRAALVRNKQRDGLFPVELGKVVFLGARLFRTDVYFPANVPTGNYTVKVFLIRDGQVVSAQTTPLFVSKIGMEAKISQFAHRNSFYYGLFAVVLALMAGWFADFVFRRV